MTRLDPGALTLPHWQIDSIVAALAALIADQAVDDPSHIPEKLIAAYHDALQLKATVKELCNSTAEASMPDEVLA